MAEFLIQSKSWEEQVVEGLFAVAQGQVLHERLEGEPALEVLERAQEERLYAPEPLKVLLFLFVGLAVVHAVLLSAALLGVGGGVDGRPATENFGRGL